MTFLNDDFFKGTDWRSVERTIARTMSHCGWRDVRVIGGAGDGGGDIIGIRTEKGRNLIFVVQVKAIMGDSYVGKAAIEQVKDAMVLYGGNVGIVATNGTFTSSAIARRDELKKAGFDIRTWNGKTLTSILEEWPEYHHERFSDLRRYQEDIVGAACERFNSGFDRCQFVVATGLGKTVIAAELVTRLFREGTSKVLVMCHQRDLALQLEQGFWRQIGKSVPTRVFFDGVPPKPIDGINFGLYQTFTSYLSGIDPYDYDVVVVDEAHHALAHGFRKCISHLKPRFLVGMTATPWRGDGQNIDDVFGKPIEPQVSLVDGMQMGYLATVDYRMFADTIKWQDVPRLTKGTMTIRDLNKRLFIPQRDEAVAGEVMKICKGIKQPRGIVFCSSIEHCHRFSGLFMSMSSIPCIPISGVEKRDRQKTLMKFGAGEIPFVSAVDVLNEGIDVPDVNLVVFLRSTHSRRIFVQQLGRGLRIAKDKDTVVVADFVTDIRRIAEVMDMDQKARRPQSEYCVLQFDSGLVKFEGGDSLPFVVKWLEDVADVADADESSELKFPEAV